MVRYKAGYKYVNGAVHAQVIDFPSVISSGENLEQARKSPAAALFDLAVTRLELGQSLPSPDFQATDVEMDIEEPIYLHLSVSTDVLETPTGEVAT